MAVNNGYERGTFFDTECCRTRVHDYREMYLLLKELDNEFPDAKQFVVGRTTKIEDFEPLDIYGLEVSSTSDSRHTLFFVGGHHSYEEAGSETVYQLARKFLKSTKPSNLTVREHTTLIFVPQINSTWYNGFRKSPRKELNSYFSEENEIFCGVKGLFCSQEAKSIKEMIGDKVSRYGQPLIGFDFHENEPCFIDPNFDIIDSRCNQVAYVLEEVSKTYPVVTSNEITYAGDLGFRNYLGKTYGAMAFTTETPAGKELKDRVKMNLIAVDRTLSGEILGI